MSSKITVADIMTTHLTTLKSDATLEDAHELTRSKGIRHLPVLDKDTGEICALLTQKKMIAKVVSLISLYGHQSLERREKRTSVMEVAETEFDVVNPTMTAKDVATYFLNNRHGCLPVVDNHELVGIITSSDFVRLSVQLLQD